MTDDDTMLDARVRRGLQSLPVVDDVRTGAALADVTRRAHRHPARPWRIALVAAVAVGLLVLAPQLLRPLLADEEIEPAPRPVGELRGSWSRTLAGAEDPAWDGAWTIGFGGRGVLAVSPPRAVAGADGAAYAVSGAQVRVDAFVNGVCDQLPPGTYAWSRSGAGLRLTAVDDACAPRVELLTGTWREVP